MIRNTTSFSPRALRLALLGLTFGLSATATTSFADEVRTAGTVTVTPGGRTVVGGLRTAVVSATDTSGDTAIASAALLAANVALNRVPGYVAVPAKDVASAFAKVPLSDKLDAKDIMEIGKRSKAKRALALTVTPGDLSDTSASYSAIAELYDTATGGLVGRGEGTFTATADAVVADTPTPAPINSGTAAQALPNRALGGAVFQAINELNRPATFQGVVVSMPGAYQARISLGERAGLRNGARVEYVRNGDVLGYGSVYDVGNGESIATIAPEAAAPFIGVNTEVRTISNPSAARAGKSAREQDDADFNRFEREFGISAAIAGVVYFISTR
ncbi:MAG TPA: hypothetical protein VF681_13710 [Abditibacteriaceae bacterium]|jgi:hypothetical protein